MSLGLLNMSSIHLNMCLYGNDEQNTHYVRSDVGGNSLDKNQDYQVKKLHAQQVANLYEMYGTLAKITGVAIAVLALLCLTVKSTVLKVLSCFVFVPLSLTSLVGGKDLSNTAINIRAICEKGNQYLRYTNGELELDIVKIGQYLQQNTLFVGAILTNRLLNSSQRM